MSFFPETEETNTQRELIEVGTHEAYCYGVVDLGTHERKPFKGAPKSPARAMRLFFEFTEQLRKFKEDGPDEPMVKNQKFNYFTGETSALYALCASWLGKKVTDTDFSKLPGTPASITISHDVSESDGKTYDNMSIIAPLSAKLIPLMPKMYNPALTFSIMQDGFDSDKFKAMCEGRYAWVSKIIMESAEYKEYLAGPKASQADCPFNE